MRKCTVLFKFYEGPEGATIYYAPKTRTVVLEYKGEWLIGDAYKLADFMCECKDIDDKSIILKDEADAELI